MSEKLKRKKGIYLESLLVVVFLQKTNDEKKKKSKQKKNKTSTLKTNFLIIIRRQFVGSVRLFKLIIHQNFHCWEHPYSNILLRFYINIYNYLTNIPFISIYIKKILPSYFINLFVGPFMLFVVCLCFKIL